VLHEPARLRGPVLFCDAMRYNASTSSGEPTMTSVPSDAELGALAQATGERLLAARQMLVTAESCTGGWIAKAVTDIAGSSAWFDCGMAVYSYEAKQAMLGVNPHTL
jgi:nicotinamide-nucleotide amidase